MKLYSDSGVISISAIRACGAAAFDNGRKNENNQKKKNFKKKNFNLFFQIYFLQICCQMLLITANLRPSTQHFVKKTVFRRISHFLAKKCLGQFFQKSDLSAGGGRRRPPSAGAIQPQNRCYATVQRSLAILVSLAIYTLEFAMKLYSDNWQYW